MEKHKAKLLVIGNMLKEAGFQPGEMKLEFLKEFTAAPGFDPKGTADDAANACRHDPQLSRVVCISPDIPALTAGATVGNGFEGTFRDARAIFRASAGLSPSEFLLRSEISHIQLDRLRSGLAKSRVDIVDAAFNALRDKRVDFAAFGEPLVTPARPCSSTRTKHRD